MSRPHRQTRRATVASPHKQRGVAAVFFGIAIVALVTMVALGFNIGQLYFAQRDMERQGALAALSGVQVASGCRAGGVPGSIGAVTDAVSNSLTTNTSANSVLPTASIRVGRINHASTQYPGYNVFEELAAGNPNIDSVQVNLTRPQPPVIAAGLFSTGTGAAMFATATATQQATANFNIGTTTASINTNQATLLNSLIPKLLGSLGTSLSLSAVDYMGLAQSQISLAQLMVAAGVTDLSHLLAATITAPTGVTLLNDALGNTVSSSVSNALQGLAAGSATVGNNVLADLLGGVGNTLNPTVTDALSQLPFINGLDLLQAIAEDSAAQSGAVAPIALPVKLNLLGISGNVFLSVLQAPQLGFGAVGMPSATARTAQIVLDLDLQVGGNTGGLIAGLLNAVANVNLALRVNVAPATGTLTKLSCPTTNNPMPSAQVHVTTGVANLTLGAIGAGKAPQPPTGGTLINIASGLLTVSVSGAAGPESVGSGTADLIFSNYVLPPSPADMISGYGYTAILDANNPSPPVASTNLLSTLNAGLSDLAAKLQPVKLQLGPISIPLPVGTLVSLLTSILSPALSSLDSLLLDPLLKSLGLEVGEASVQMNSVSIGAPRVTTFCSPTKPCLGGVPNT